MSARRPLSVLAALVLLSPLAAVAVPACSPGQRCPMAGAVGDSPPCRGTMIQADNCCLSAETAEPAAVVSAIAATAVVIDDGVPAPLPESGEEVSSVARDNPPSTLLYRLFRALLI